MGITENIKKRERNKQKLIFSLALYSPTPTPTPMSRSSANSTVVEHENLAQIEIGNRGLRKQILRKGISWQTPFPGDEVQVGFSGHIEGGACLESSGDEGLPFKFKVGQGEVIRGWEEGIATMKKGEKATLRIPPELGYGDVGCPPLIPPNSTLIYTIEMLSWSTIRDVTGDGGVLKKITREGHGWATPRDADQVLVKYEARLDDGLIVSKSEEGMTFHVGDGRPCSAINRAVRTMRRGEKAELAVKFSYGFQDTKGCGSTNIGVPSDSKLTIDLELLSWNSVADITGDKSVLKKITKVGEGFERPNEGSLVKVKYVIKHDDGTIIERKGSDEQPFQYICLEEQISEGLDRAIMTMKKGEQALVTVTTESSSYANDVSATLSGKPMLRYEVELIDFTKEKPFWKMNANEKLEASERKKQDGNVMYKAGKFWRASKKYEKAAKFVEFSHSFTDDEKRRAKALWLSCSLNNAACKLKLQDYHEASKLCTKVLELEPANVKALYRRSQAYMRITELEKAEADIKKALSIDPNNRDVKVEYKELKERQREYARYESEIFGTMFSRMG